MTSRSRVTVSVVAGFAMLGAGSVHAQSEWRAAASGTVWEEFAQMASPTTCAASSAPKLQRQFGGQLAPEPKMRFIAITAGDPGQMQAIRVTWNQMPNWQGPQLVDQKKWMTAPFQVCENAAQGLASPPPGCAVAPGMPQRWFWSARLTCDPTQAWFGDLNDFKNYCTGRAAQHCAVDADCEIPTGDGGTCGVDGVIHLSDFGIVPSRVAGGVMTQAAVYSVQVIDAKCSLAADGDYSDPLVTRTAGWGDFTGAVGACPASLPNNSADLVGDVTEAIRKFSNLLCAPKKTRVDIDADFVIDFPVDVIGLLDAFTQGGGGFQVSPLAACPDDQ